MVIAEARLDLSLKAALVDSATVDPKSGRDLFDSQPSLLEQTFFEALDLRRIADPLDAYGVEGIASAGAHPALVEDMGNLGIGILIQQTVDIVEDAQRTPGKVNPDIT